MDIQKNVVLSTYTSSTLPPAQLWIGPHEQLVEEVHNFAQKMFCPHDGCQTCTICMHIRDKQHHALMWLHPDKTYTIEQLNDLFSRIAFRLEKNELFFFIIQKADFLSVACANKLLKSMEEPPQGYHFILLTDRTDNILPTILSRCTIHTLPSSKMPPSIHPLVKSFTTDHVNPMEFSKIVEASAINEKESIDLLDEILHYWLLCYKNKKNAPEKKYFELLAIITTLKKAYTQLPMPGSTFIFWRNLYLNLHRSITTMTE